MTTCHPVVFLLEDTLIDNDRIAADLKRHLEQEVGRERQEGDWAIFEVSSFMVNYPFANRLYPNSLDGA